jgi:cysteine desulfurase/selenocysteine lyase
MKADGTAMTYDVQALRRDQFPWTAEHIYLDHASIGPLPSRTLAAVEAYNRNRAAPYRLNHATLFDVLTRSRQLAGRLIGADPDEIALTVNTSYGLNLAARMLPLEEGDVVLTSDREFPANIYPWLMLKDKGVTLERVPVTEHGWPDEERILARLDDPRVRVLAVSLVQFHTGFRLDLDRLGERCRATGTMLVVDAIQALGVLPFDVRETPVDILSCGAQKWLCSPWGSGFMYVNRAWHDRLTPSFAGWTAFEGTADFTAITSYDERWLPDARRYELISLPFQDFAGMNESLELLLSLDPGAIARHVLATHQPVLEMADRRGLRVTSPRDHHVSGMVCVEMPDLIAAHAALKENGITASRREGAIRISPHCYNTVEELEVVAGVLEKSLSR